MLTEGRPVPETVCDIEIVGDYFSFLPKLQVNHALVTGVVTNLSLSFSHEISCFFAKIWRVWKLKELLYGEVSRKQFRCFEISASNICNFAAFRTHCNCILVQPKVCIYPFLTLTERAANNHSPQLTYWFWFLSTYLVPAQLGNSSSWTHTKFLLPLYRSLSSFVL